MKISRVYSGKIGRFGGGRRRTLRIADSEDSNFTLNGPLNAFFRNLYLNVLDSLLFAEDIHPKLSSH